MRGRSEETGERIEEMGEKIEEIEETGKGRQRRREGKSGPEI